MKNIFKNVIKYTLISLAGFLIWIVLTGILEYNKVIFLYNPIFLIIGIIIYMLIIVLVYKYIVPKIMKLNFIEYILMGIFTIICIISGLYNYVLYHFLFTCSPLASISLIHAAKVH